VNLHVNLCERREQHRGLHSGKPLAKSASARLSSSPVSMSRATLNTRSPPAARSGPNCGSSRNRGRLARIDSALRPSRPSFRASTAPSRI
jgi:hypothetical protein